MKIWMLIFMMLNLAGWLGVVELLWTCWEDYLRNGAIKRQTRIIIYCAVTLVFLLTEIRATLFAPL